METWIRCDGDLYGYSISSLGNIISHKKRINGLDGKLIWIIDYNVNIPKKKWNETNRCRVTLNSKKYTIHKIVQRYFGNKK